MLFESIAGHTVPKRILSRALETGKLSHSYVFWGPEGVGKKFLAVHFAQALACPNKLDGCGCPSCKQAEAGVHPDIHLIIPEGGNIKIESVRMMIEVSFLKPVFSPWIINILDEADRLTLEAANSLLKLLEEPPSNVVNILITSRPYSLPPTILSRCYSVPFGFLNQEEIAQALSKQKTEKMDLITSIASGRVGEAIYWAQPDNWKRREKYLGTGLQLASGNISFAFVDSLLKEREKRRVLDFLKVLLSLWRDLTLLSAGVKKIANIDHEKNLLELSGLRETQEWVTGCFQIEEALELSYTNINMSMLLVSLLISLSQKRTKERGGKLAT